jgi:endonuclease/exonuclease/phosphatase (EEP) superfamily protein YafD
VAIAAYAAILFAMLMPDDWSNTSGRFLAAWTVAFMIATFSYHIGLFVLAIALAAAWWRKWRLVLASAPLACLIVGPVLASYRPKHPPAPRGQTFTIMSANLLVLNHDTQSMIDEVRRVKPDVLLLQEYAPHWHHAIHAALAGDYPHSVTLPREDAFGAALYSRLPFAESPRVDVGLAGEKLPEIRAVVECDGQHVAVYNLHLLPPRRLDYVRVQRAQLADLIEMLRREPLPFIVGGDFNFTPRSPNAAALRRLGLREAQSIAGVGPGHTWPVLGVLRYLAVPGIRLDQLYLSDALTCTAVETGEGQGSDHRPVHALIGLR